MFLDTYSARLEALQQIPLFAVRQFLQQTMERRSVELAVAAHMEQLRQDDGRQARSSVVRLSREQLTRLVAMTHEIPGAAIAGLFEEYRYGANPTFYVHIFDKTKLGRQAFQGFKQRLDEQLRLAGGSGEEDVPRLRSVLLNDVVSLPEKPEVLEGSYRYLSRIDFVDEEQQAVCRYQTLYGLFWINSAEGYVIIHARNAQVLKTVRTAIEKATKVKLTSLVISKQLKNALPFLVRDSFREGHLHDPDPGPGRFRWMTVSDDNPYAKGYKELEKGYPEVRSARYKETVDGDKETTLTIRSNRGALSLAGVLKASQMRHWTLDRLGQLISVLNDFRPDAPAYVQTKTLRDVPELARLTVQQRDLVLKLVSALLSVKQSPTVGFQGLEVSPIELAVGLPHWLRVQVPVENKADSEEGEGYLSCPVCDSTVFSLRRKNEKLTIECREHKRQPWGSELPVSVEASGGDDVLLDETEMANSIELLPDQDLLETLSEVINHHLPGYTFDSEKESFIVRGPHLLYFPDRSKIRDAMDGNARTVVYVNQHIGRLQGGEVLGVKSDEA